MAVYAAMVLSLALHYYEIIRFPFRVLYSTFAISLLAVSRKFLSDSDQRNRWLNAS